MNIGIENEYVEHGNVDILKTEVGIDKATIVSKIVKEYAGLRE